jgi:hypothetical protein
MRQLAFLIFMILLSVASPSVAAPVAHCAMPGEMAGDCCPDHSMVGCLAAHACSACNASALATFGNPPVTRKNNPVHAVAMVQAMYPLASAPEPPPPRTDRSIPHF